MRSTRLFIALGCLTFLAACSTETTVTPVAAEPDTVTIKLGQAADKASQALDGIARIERQRAPVSAAPEDYSKAPPSLMQPITIRWSGPIEQIAKTLADRAGLQFRVTGLPPAAPITVTLDIYQQPLMQVLENIGLQAGQRADVAVDARAGYIGIRYAPIDR